MAQYSGRCPDCGAAIDEQARWCSACGTDLRAEVLLLDAGGGPGGRRPAAPSLAQTPGRSGRRDVVFLIGVVLLVVIALAALAGSEPAGEDAASASSTTSPPSTLAAGAPPTNVTRLTTPTTTVTGSQSPADPSGITLVLVAERRIDAADLGTGAVTPLVETRPSRGGALFAVPTTAGAVVSASRDGQAVAELTPVAGPPVNLGRADAAYASSRPERVWLLATDPADGTVVREVVAAEGGPETASFAIPPDAVPVAAVDDGLVVQALGQVYLLEADGPRLLFEGQAIAAHGSTVARLACNAELHCGLHLTDVDGTDRLVPPPDGGGHFGAGPAAFSPDGASLFLPVTVALPNGPAERLALVDLDDAAVTVVPDSGTFDDYGSPAWSRPGDWLFWRTGNDVVGYRLGTGEPVGLGLDARAVIALVAL